MDEIRRCERCRRPRDNKNSRHYCPICLLKINEKIEELTKR